MLLFKPEHVLPILQGNWFDVPDLGLTHYFKDETRREWPRGPRVKVGALHQCRTRMLIKNTTFAVVRIDALRREELCEITDDGARHEGYPSREAYFEVYGRIYSDVKQHDHRLVYAVRFTAVKVPCFSCEGTKIARLPGGTTETCWLCDDEGFVDLTEENRIGAIERRRRATTRLLGSYQ